MAEPATNVITGRDGTFKFGVADATATSIEVKDWKLTRKNKVAALATSLTAGFQTTAEGITSWDLSFTAILPAGAFNPAAGMDVGVKGNFNGTSTAGKQCTGNCRIDSMEEAIPIEGGELTANIHAIGDGPYSI